MLGPSPGKPNKDGKLEGKGTVYAALEVLALVSLSLYLAALPVAPLARQPAVVFLAGGVKRSSVKQEPGLDQI